MCTAVPPFKDTIPVHSVLRKELCIRNIAWKKNPRMKTYRIEYNFWSLGHHTHPYPWKRDAETVKLWQKHTIKSHFQKSPEKYGVILCKVRLVMYVAQNKMMRETVDLISFYLWQAIKHWLCHTLSLCSLQYNSYITMEIGTREMLNFLKILRKPKLFVLSMYSARKSWNDNPFFSIISAI